MYYLFILRMKLLDDGVFEKTVYILFNWLKNVKSINHILEVDYQSYAYSHLLSARPTVNNCFLSA